MPPLQNLENHNDGRFSSVETELVRPCKKIIRDRSACKMLIIIRRKMPSIKMDGESISWIKFHTFGHSSHIIFGTHSMMTGNTNLRKALKVGASFQAKRVFNPRICAVLSPSGFPLTFVNFITGSIFHMDVWVFLAHGLNTDFVLQKGLTFSRLIAPRLLLFSSNSKDSLSAFSILFGEIGNLLFTM